MKIVSWQNKIKRKSYCDTELFKLPLMFSTVTLSHMLDRVPQDLIGPYNSLSFATSTHTLCCSHASLNHAFFQNLHALISMLYKTVLFPLKYPPTSNIQPFFSMFLHPLKPRSDVAFLR